MSRTEPVGVCSAVWIEPRCGPIPPEATKMCVGGGGLSEALYMVAGDAMCMSESTIQVTTFLTSSVSTDRLEEGFL